MQSILAKQNSGATHRSLSPRDKAQAALETLRGQRSVIEIARHWQVNPDDLLQWQHTLVDRAAGLFGEEGSAASIELADVRLANEALIHQVFVQMDAKDDLQQSSQQLHRLIAHQDQRKEAERKRLAVGIHDDLAQNLLAIRIDISMLQDRTRVRHPQLHRRVSVVLANIDCAIRASRAMINELRPFELELGLPAVVQWQLNRFEQLTGLAVELEIAGFDDECFNLGDDVTLTIFRILQDSLCNVAQHAEASRVQVRLHRTDAGVALVVQDDGVGAKRSVLRDEASFGLATMRERLGALGGSLQLDTPRGGGTCFRSWIPLGPGGPP